jgi:hypothetical protein
LQFFIFGRLQLGCVDLAGLEAIEFQLLTSKRSTGTQFLNRSASIVELEVNRMILFTQIAQTGVLIQHFELVGRLEQILMIVLAMNIDKRFGKLAQHRERNRIAVEADTAPAARKESAGEKQFAFGCDGDIRRPFDLLQHWPAQPVENAADAALLRAGPEHFGGASQTQEQLDSSDNQALAGPGCPRETVQPGMQFDAGVGDDGKVGNVQLAQHSNPMLTQAPSGNRGRMEQTFHSLESLMSKGDLMLRKFLLLACTLGFGVGLMGAGSGCIIHEHHDPHYWDHDDHGWHHHDDYR